MKLFAYLIPLLLVLVSCKKDVESNPPLEKKYGEGMYIGTDNGVSFYDGVTVENQIFQQANGITLSNVEKINFQGTKAYILCANELFTANVKTFGYQGSVGSFINAVDFDFVTLDNRILVVDKGDSKVKFVDEESLQITSDIETGDNTSPNFILTKSYLGTGRAIVMNGGVEADSLKDSTIVAIDYKDQNVPLADMMGSLYVGDNPNSAVNISNLRVLCKGIYDSNNLISKTQSSLVIVNPWTMEVYTTQYLSGIYNAKNLTSNNDGTVYYFTAENGFYQMDKNGTGISLINGLLSDICVYNEESYSQYSVADSTTYYYTRDVLYLNDSENSKNTIYKYNVNSNVFMDTINVEGNVKDINFY